MPELTLYHFTCDHGYEGILKSGYIRPNDNDMLRALSPLIWLTDLPCPERDQIGLSMGELITCDRLLHRFTVKTSAAHPWTEMRGRAPRWTVAMLERFGAPRHWYIIRRPILASEFTCDY